jgi:hypothetical protein
VTGALPNLVVIGAAKSGTTSLHRYLDLHPDVAMSKIKELKFFDRENWRDDVAWYRSQFDPSAPVRGESSPTYTVNPYYGPVPERMAALIPDARLVYVVRDPLDRLIAHWIEWVHVFHERRTFAESLRDYDSPSNPYTAASRYATQLDRFDEFFDEQQLLVLDQVDLRDDREATLNAVFGFVGLGPLPDSSGLDELHNVREEKRWPSRAGLVLADLGVAQQLRDRARRLPPAMRRPLKRLGTRPVERPQLDPVLHAELEAYLREDADRLRARTGRSFAHWAL